MFNRIILKTNEQKETYRRYCQAIETGDIREEIVNVMRLCGCTDEMIDDQIDFAVRFREIIRKNSIEVMAGGETQR